MIISLWLTETADDGYDCWGCHEHRNVYHCPFCGEDQEHKSNFCPDCGKKMIVDTEKDKPIYTHNRATDIVELFEDVLDANGIMVPDEDRTGDEGEACLYGMTYANLLDTVEEKIVSVLEDAGVDVDSPKRVVTGIYQ